MCVCVRACVHACVHLCVPVSVYVCVRAHGYMHAEGQGWSTRQAVQFLDVLGWAALQHACGQAGITTAHHEINTSTPRNQYKHACGHAGITTAHHEINTSSPRNQHKHACGHAGITTAHHEINISTRPHLRCALRHRIFFPVRGGCTLLMAECRAC